jgi:hypothetical protein
MELILKESGADSMIEPPEIARSRVEKEPQLIWETFVDFISRADTREMNDIQMVAQLTFWYDSEVRNGGHWRYFENGYLRLENKLTVLIMATLEALKILKAHKQAEILGGASDLYFSQPRRHTVNPEEISRIRPGGEFAPYDDEYLQWAADFKAQLEIYMMANREHFVKLV